ncbi:MAG: PLDc N-terminal domain-containing protein [Chitinophagaceae bacterium]|nr:PLDc N-terminal domain-containing protein [Chitinophagaceae bacterium]
MEHLTNFFGYFLLSLIFFLIGAVILTFIMFVRKRTDINDNTKILWVLFFIFVPVISFLVYLMFGYKRKANY